MKAEPLPPVRWCAARRGDREGGPAPPRSTTCTNPTPTGGTAGLADAGPGRRLPHRAVATLALLALYPLLTAIFPWLATAQVLGVPLTLLILGGGIYPPLVLLGYWYVRRAERLEQQFVELLKEQ